jgi:hypothetical protein
MPAQNPMEYPHWDGLTVKEFVDWMGVGDDLHKTLHAIDKHNIEAIDVWIGGKWFGPDDPTDRISDDSAIQKLRVRGIAWDGSDWEWGEEISGNDSPNIVMGNLAELRGRFREALGEYEADRDAQADDNEIAETEKHIVLHDLMTALANLRNEATGYLADLNRHGIDATTLRGAIKQAEAAIADAREIGL